MRLIGAGPTPCFCTYRPTHWVRFVHIGLHIGLVLLYAFYSVIVLFVITALVRGMCLY